MRRRLLGLSATVFWVVMFCVIGAGVNLFAQDSSYALRFGVYGGYALNNHLAEFTKIEGTQSCCLGFNGGSGKGIAIGLLAEKQLSEVFLMNLRLNYVQLNGNMTTPEATTILLGEQNSAGVFEHRLDAKLAVGGIEPLLGFRILDNILLYEGLRVGFFLSKQYEQKEQIVQPSGVGTFADGNGQDTRKRTRNEFSGNIPTVNALQMSAVLGLSMEFPLKKNGGLYLAPELWYDFGLTNITPRSEKSNWSVNSWRFGLALKFGTPFVNEPEQERRQQRFIDTLRLPKPSIASEEFVKGESITRYDTLLSEEAQRITTFIRRTDTLFVPLPPAQVGATIHLVGIDEKGNEVAVRSLRVEEFLTSYSTPLLRYIFFEENASEIPARYKRLDASGIGAFRLRDVDASDKLATYYQILNIVGKRLKDNPQSRLRITGCTQDIRAEKGNIALARQRAQAVQNYLNTVWGIEEKRLEIEARELPLLASNSQTTDGAEENRRVELYSDNAYILAPLTNTDTARGVAPAGIRFMPHVSHSTSTVGWRFAVQQGTRLLKSFEAKGEVPRYLYWNPAQEKTELPSNDVQLEYRFEVQTTQGSAHAVGNIDVEQISISRKRTEGRSDKEIDRFSLILFPVRSAELGEENVRLLQAVKNRIQVDSRVSIRGYADRSGDAMVNRQLAENRARNTAEALNLRDSASVSGESLLYLFDNNLPEGRFYCRTVDILVETPVR